VHLYVEEEEEEEEEEEGRKQYKLTFQHTDQQHAHVHHDISYPHKQRNL